MNSEQKDIAQFEIQDLRLFLDAMEKELRRSDSSDFYISLQIGHIWESAANLVNLIQSAAISSQEMQEAE